MKRQLKTDKCFQCVVDGKKNMFYVESLPKIAYDYGSFLGVEVDSIISRMIYHMMCLRR